MVTYGSASSSSSLFHFLRVGALIGGVSVGMMQAGGYRRRLIQAHKTAISERDGKIAELEEKLKEAKADPATMNPSSGDPIQDWVDSLNK
mmetsp:Transcript_6770/g.13813  ORF Transcript_6770/g.13813 Transcript_6770/m.13813 type:complete len:90 (+) Transcript_6770:120-389(+)|eukprot:CAMPEP_0184680012 /NCGR_PEP_ID=MMETSP0312-20130426/2877_1 /TAXON_ID=31354 /ORGANISM="Compsopogon coeruleus, Strain SAG 36.94" /LENGTH=89 /DNA_ID=CAMNT_0027129825 /DNA_START=93 /DNA_END=362 /DNA_ORIENTATION=-